MKCDADIIKLLNDIDWWIRTAPPEHRTFEQQAIADRVRSVLRQAVTPGDGSVHVNAEQP